MAEHHSHTLSYAPLYGSNIRLLVLERGVADDPLQGSLKQVSLDDGPEYEALLYVWGDSQTPHHLHTPNGDKPITSNLYASLKRLRQPEGDRILWIDAICIYSHRTVMKHLKILRFVPQFFEGFNVTYLT